MNDWLQEELESDRELFDRDFIRLQWSYGQLFQCPVCYAAVERRKAIAHLEWHDN